MNPKSIDIQESVAHYLTLLLAILALVGAVGARPALADDGDEADSLYISDGGDDTVKRYDAKTGAYLGSFVSPGSGGLHGPQGLIFLGGKLHVANQNVDLPFAGEILRYAKTGDFLNALVPCNPPLGRNCDVNAPSVPRGLIRGLDRSLYVADFDFSAGRIAKYDASTGKFLGNFDTTGFTGAFIPRGIVLGPDGLVYVSVTGNLAAGDSLSGYVLRFTHTGKFVDVFASHQGQGCAALCTGPRGWYSVPMGISIW